MVQSPFCEFSCWSTRKCDYLGERRNNGKKENFVSFITKRLVPREFSDKRIVSFIIHRQVILFSMVTALKQETQQPISKYSPTDNIEINNQMFCYSFNKNNGGCDINGDWEQGKNRFYFLQIRPWVCLFLLEGADGFCMDDKDDTFNKQHCFGTSVKCQVMPSSPVTGLIPRRF